jgi:hypothetical protein
VSDEPYDIVSELKERAEQAEDALAEAQREWDSYKADYERISASHGEWVDLHTRQEARLATLEKLLDRSIKVLQGLAPGTLVEDIKAALDTGGNIKGEIK